MSETTAAIPSRDTAGAWLTPADFARQLERRGPIFVKVGQFLALRPDLIPQEYCNELLKLLDRVAPFSWNDASLILTEDLGRPPEESFASINHRPIASASLAQVYLARTHGGREVAVKVQRPGIRERMDADLKQARRLLRLLEFTGKVSIVDRGELLAELERWMYEELDFTRELENVRAMRDLVQPGGRIRIPRPYPELSGKRVVTTEFLRGVPFSELLAALREGRPGQIDRIGFDRDLLAQTLLHSVLTSVFRYQTFHADVHPGNLIALESDRIGFVDFGLVDVLDETIRERQTLYLAAVYRGDVDEMYRSLLEILIPNPNWDPTRFTGTSSP